MRYTHAHTNTFKHAKLAEMFDLKTRHVVSSMQASEHSMAVDPPCTSLRLTARQLREIPLECASQPSTFAFRILDIDNHRAFLLLFSSCHMREICRTVSHARTRTPFIPCVFWQQRARWLREIVLEGGLSPSTTEME